MAHRQTDRQTRRTVSLPAVQRHRGLLDAFLVISSTLTPHSIANLPAHEQSCPDPLVQHSPVWELLLAGICVGRMLTALQPPATLTAGCFTAFILLAAASCKILLRCRVASGLRAERQFSHQGYRETHTSYPQGCWAALEPLCQAGETRATPEIPHHSETVRGGSPPSTSRGGPCGCEWVVHNQHTQAATLRGSDASKRPTDGRVKAMIPCHIARQRLMLQHMVLS